VGSVYYAVQHVGAARVPVRRRSFDGVRQLHGAAAFFQVTARDQLSDDVVFGHGNMQA